MRILIFVCMMGFAADAQSIKVMTYNVRFDNPGDGVNQWEKRKEKLSAVIKDNNPDLIGVQEALINQLQDLVQLLPAYQYAGVGRDDGKEKGEYSAILFNSERFRLIRTETSWLSETPTLPGSKSWDAAITRVVTQAVFEDRASGKRFIHFNTHFDHVGKEARLQSAQMIRKMVDQIDEDFPVIVTGDFNAEPSERAYQEMVRTASVVDTRPREAADGTFCTFAVNSQPCRLIDYIFCSSAWQSSDYRVIKTNDGAWYPSDHLPVLVTLRLGGK